MSTFIVKDGQGKVVAHSDYSSLVLADYFDVGINIAGKVSDTNIRRIWYNGTNSVEYNAAFFDVGYTATGKWTTNVDYSFILPFFKCGVLGQRVALTQFYKIDAYTWGYQVTYDGESTQTPKLYLFGKIAEMNPNKSPAGTYGLELVDSTNKIVYSTERPCLRVDEAILLNAPTSIGPASINGHSNINYDVSNTNTYTVAHELDLNTLYSFMSIAYTGVGDKYETRWTESKWA